MLADGNPAQPPFDTGLEKVAGGAIAASSAETLYVGIAQYLAWFEGIDLGDTDAGLFVVRHRRSQFPRLTPG
jgi:hypothetical protein